MAFNSRAYEIPYSGKIPEEMYIFILAMMADALDANSIPVEIHKTAELKRAVLDILTQRQTLYTTSLEEDERLLRAELGARERMAVEVRQGEKRILRRAFERVDAWVVSPPAKRIKTQ